MQFHEKSDKSEQVIYNFADLPIYISHGHMAEVPNYTILAHWHDDLEFGLMLSGSMDYNINGEEVRLDAGEAIFINTRQMHFNFSRERQDSEYMCLLVHPMQFCASPHVERSLVAPLLGDPSLAYRVLRGEYEWARKICRDLRSIFDCRQEPDAPLTVQAALFQIWAGLYKNAPKVESAPKYRSQSLNSLQDMIAYIRKNYQSKISLEDIARSGSMSKTSCCNTFQKYVNQSPAAYLIEYRLRNGIDLLRSTDMSITEICYEVGFSGPSYFSESFRKAFGCSPVEFRKKFVGS